MSHRIYKNESLSIKWVFIGMTYSLQTHSAKATWDGKGLIHCIAYCQFQGRFGAGSEGRNLEAGTEAGVVEECCFLACSLWLTRVLSYITQGFLSHSGLGPSHQSIHKKNNPHTSLKAM